ncbi:hypothetical protein CH275_06165 [Rhodococcus sp. 06-235-1A]|nr:hypothetical protein CH275_06165 [Rhodococcus sp. 06-235-1A]
MTSGGGSGACGGTSVPAVGRRVVLTTVSSDAHTWNLVFLALLLEEHGHTVVNLGPCVPDEVVVQACRRIEPDVLVVSTVNGHGCIDGVRLIERIRAEIGGVPAVIGGKLTTMGESGHERTAQLLDAGFDSVFLDASDLDGLTRFLDSADALTSVGA